MLTSANLLSRAADVVRTYPSATAASVLGLGFGVYQYQTQNTPLAFIPICGIIAAKACFIPSYLKRDMTRLYNLYSYLTTPIEQTQNAAENVRLRLNSNRRPCSEF